MYYRGVQSDRQRCRGLLVGNYWIKICFLLLLMISLLCGCQSRNYSEKDTKLKKIVVGVDKFEPYTYLDVNGNYTGIDIDIAKKVFHKLGYEPEFKMISWNDKNTLLSDGTIDCIWSCYSMNEREEEYQWAGPYLYSRQVIAVRADSAIKNLADLKGKTVGVQITTRAAGLFLHTTKSSIPKVKQVNSFATTDDMFAAIRKGYVDAIAGHEALINELIKNEKGEYRLLEESPHISKAGVAFKKGTHVKLTQRMNKQIKKMSKDGSISDIVEKYGLDADKVVVKGEADEK